MSIRMIDWAYQRDLPCAQKFVLVTLANHANQDGWCWPSQSTIARECGICRQHVNTVLGQLEAAGLIEIEHRRRSDGRQAANHYRVLCAMEPVADDARQSQRRHAPESSSLTSRVVHDDTKNNRQEEPSRQPRTISIAAGAARNISQPAPEVPSTPSTPRPAQKRIQPPPDDGMVSDDGRVHLTADDLDELAEDLAWLPDVRGHARQALRVYSHLPPPLRLNAVRNFLMKKDRETAARAVDIAASRKTSTSTKPRGVYGDEWM